MDQTEFNPTPGVAETLEPGIRRVLAPNPSPMTFRGTNTYLVGEGDVAVIDPGPALPAHLDAILAGIGPGERITHILVTHSHVDHAPLARPLAEATGAPILAFGPSAFGRSEVMRRLAQAGLTGGGEGVQADFQPDERLHDTEAVTGQSWSLTALWTPGHMANHMCFAFGDAVFTGDLIMGWASTMVSPPDGDVAAFMASTRRLATREDRVFYPGHGAEVSSPGARVKELLAHRQSREAEILGALRRGHNTVQDITQAVYTDVPMALLPAAERNVFAHLIDLTERSVVAADPELSIGANFSKS